VFPTTADYPLGQLNPDSYGTLAWVLAASVIVAVLITTHFTRVQIPYLMQPQGPHTRYRLSRLLEDGRLALRNREFLILLGAVLTSAIVIGTVGPLEIYMRTYFWGLGTDSLRWWFRSRTSSG